MNTSTIIENIASKIEAGDYEGAFTAFESNFKNEKKLSKYVSLCNQFKEVLKSFAEGIISLSEYMLEENKLVKELLNALSLISKKFKYASKRKKIRIEFTIGGKIADWTETMGKKIKTVLSTFLDIPNHSINIVSLSAGSIKVVLELPESAVTELLAGSYLNNIEKELADSKINLIRVRPVYEITRTPLVGVSGGGGAAKWLRYIGSIALVGIIGFGVYNLANRQNPTTTVVTEATEVGDTPIDPVIQTVEKDIQLTFEVLNNKERPITNEKVLRAFSWSSTPTEKEFALSENVLQFTYPPDTKGRILLKLDDQRFSFNKRFEIGAGNQRIVLKEKTRKLNIEFYYDRKLHSKLRGTLLYQLNSPNNPRKKARIRNGRAQLDFNPSQHRAIYFKFHTDMSPSAIGIVNEKHPLNSQTNLIKLETRSTID